MRPRGLAGTWLVMAMVSGPPFGVLWGAWMALFSPAKAAPIAAAAALAAVLFGLVFGGVMATRLRAEEATIGYRDRDAFLAALATGLARLGYHPESQVADVYTFKPSLSAGLLAGRITVRSGATSASVLGPVTYVRRLETALGEPGALPAHPHRG